VGNHLAVPTGHGWLHHMVVTSVDRRAGLRLFVTHFWGETNRKADATVRRSELCNFRELIRAGLLLRMDNQHFASTRIVKRAQYLRRCNREQYNIFHRNCEHAATWLRTGYARSPQAENVLRTVCVAVWNVVLRRV
jgi:hypothetical protein